MLLLYDLSSAPAGTLNPLPAYTRAAKTEATNMHTWADQLRIPYGYGIPASASAHEYTSCAGANCKPAANGATGDGSPGTAPSDVA